ncbi:hypothetical protein [Lichenicoccus sp.]|uniref:hypothetical protein n=1 Tax=Lichenicoccus sp. TaxID=2781899 RepID=UPI003D106D14
MTRLPLLAFAALICVLAGLILLEVRAGVPRHTLPVVAALPPPSTPIAVSAGVAAPALQEWTQTILARPLFSPSRRPGHAAAVSTVVPRLAGIIIDAKGARAIFASPGDARAIIVGAGAHAGPYLIRAVAASGVSVIGPNGPQMLHPSYDQDSSAGAASPAPPSTGTPSILDLLRARMRSQGGPHLGPPNSGPAPIFPQNRLQNRR